MNEETQLFLLSHTKKILEVQKASILQKAEESIETRSSWWRGCLAARSSGFNSATLPLVLSSLRPEHITVLQDANTNEFIWAVAFKFFVSSAEAAFYGVEKTFGSNFIWELDAGHAASAFDTISSLSSKGGPQQLIKRLMNSRPAGLCIPRVMLCDRILTTPLTSLKSLSKADLVMIASMSASRFSKPVRFSTDDVEANRLKTDKKYGYVAKFHKKERQRIQKVDGPRLGSDELEMIVNLTTVRMMHSVGDIEATMTLRNLRLVSKAVRKFTNRVVQHKLNTATSNLETAWSACMKAQEDDGSAENILSELCRAGSAACKIGIEPHDVIDAEFKQINPLKTASDYILLKSKTDKDQVVGHSRSSMPSSASVDFKVVRETPSPLIRRKQEMKSDQAMKMIVHLHERLTELDSLGSITTENRNLFRRIDSRASGSS